MSWLTSSGLTVPRAADFLAAVRADVQARYAAAGGVGEIDFGTDTAMGILTGAVSVQLGLLGEAVQAVYDARVPGTAAGACLDDLCEAVGVTRLAATASTVALTLTGTSGTVIPAGALVLGGGTDGAARWRIDEAVTLSGGTGSATATCTAAGAVAAAIGDVDQILTPVSGWTAATNAAAAVTGRALESDAALRLRRAQALRAPLAGSTAAIQAALSALDYVEAAVVIENTAGSTATVSGVSLAARSVAVILWPSTLTTAQKSVVAQAIYERLPAGVALNGSDVTATVTDAAGMTKTVLWDWADVLTVNVTAALTLSTGYTLGAVSSLVSTAIGDWFEANASVGQSVDNTPIEAYVLATVSGIRRIVVALNGSAGVDPTAAQIPTLGTVTVS
jgi:uncharacterized phage protein gp47/JayE